ncbi:MAG: hypothetical protein VB070_03505 [Clostridiaceae bacterium]|nr:hypothetical protein [Clostridiaceae bacterium]
MNESWGNLALQRKPVNTEKRMGSRSVKQRSDIKTRRIPVTATPDSNQIAFQRAKAIRRTLARQRIRLLCGLVALVFAVTGVFALVVYRQAMILEMNFNNLAKENKITLLNQEASQISESLAQKTNLDEIRRQAVEKLGLQDPAHSQVVTVDVPDSDRVVYATPKTVSADSDTYLASVFTTIEGFFKTMNRQGQGN